MTQALPFQAFLEVTRKCNQSCPFCSCPWFAEGGHNLSPELEIAEWEEVATEIVANGVRHIAVTGGEPTLKEGVPHLMKHIARLLEEYDSTTLALFTNGKNFNGEWLDILSSCNAECYTSLPGLSSFSSLTGVHDADFRSVLKVINDCATNGVRVSVGVTVCRPMLHELHETLSYAVLSGAQTIVLNLFKPTGRGASHPELLLSEAEVAEAAAVADDVAERCKGACAFVGEFPPIVVPEDYPHLAMEFGCMAAKGTFTVAPDGWLHVCEHDAEGVCHWRDWRKGVQSDKWRCFQFGVHPVCPL